MRHDRARAAGRRRSKVIACALAASAALSPLWTSARAETVDATITTLLQARQDPRDGQSYTVVPIWQSLTLDARDFKTRGIEDLHLVVSGWGSVALGEPLDARATGDLDVGYVEGGLFHHRVDVRLGRQLVVGGAARITPLDGGQVTWHIARGVGLTVYGGVPVTPRFTVHQGDAMGGGRLFWRPSTESEVGLSFAHVHDEGRAARQDLAADARYSPLRNLSLTGYLLLSLLELRVAEADFGATWQPKDWVDVRVDWHRTAPDLFLPRGSILSVFADESRDEAGASVWLRPVRRLRINADYHAIVSGFEGAPDGSELGHRGGLRLTLQAALRTSIGVEGRVLHLPDKGYQQARLFLTHRFLPGLLLSLDADTYHLEQPLNGQTVSFTGAASLGWQFAEGWSAAVTGIADVTPFVERRFECIARLAYHHTFHVREVRK